MKCVLTAVNVKLFGKAVHCLAKIGTEIYFEPLDDGLVLKTVNSSKSAFVCFLFLRPMFKTYLFTISNNDNSTLTGENGDSSFRCKVAVKTMLQVFKSLSTIERSVESCEINLDNEECRLIFQLKCRHGIKKTHQLTFQECESLQAVFDKDLSPNILTCEHKLLTDVTANFPSGLEELSMSITPCEVTVKSFVDDNEENSKIMKTEMHLNPEEFINFQVGVDTEITFCLKELRAILAFCDVAGTELQMHFEVGGKPLVISTEEPELFRANFVLATVAPNEDIESNVKTKKPPNCSALQNRSKTTSRITATTVQSRRAPKRANPSKGITINPQKAPGNMNSSHTAELGTGDNTGETLSPEIPYQHCQSMVTGPSYKPVKKVFFENTQVLPDHSIMVLAPESDGEDSS